MSLRVCAKIYFELYQSVGLKAAIKRIYAHKKSSQLCGVLPPTVSFISF
jgi:hypothetical protein